MNMPLPIVYSPNPILATVISGQIDFYNNKKNENKDTFGTQQMGLAIIMSGANKVPLQCQRFI